MGRAGPRGFGNTGVETIDMQAGGRWRAAAIQGFLV